MTAVTPKTAADSAVIQPSPAIAGLILAAGKGTRMKSALPKVMHKVGGLSMLGHVLRTAAAAGAGTSVVVIGPDMETVAKEARIWCEGAHFAVQEGQAGTGDAVKAGLTALPDSAEEVIILYGDTPLVTPSTIARMQAERAKGAGLVVLGFRPADTAAYGRLIGSEAEDGTLTVERIVEHLDASPAERAVTWCNSGIYVVSAALLKALVPKITNDNAKGEYYITDIVALARAAGHEVRAIEGDEREVLGVNSRVELALAEAEFQSRARVAAMLGGATLVDPSSVFFSFDTQLGRDVLVGPQVVFAPGVRIGDNVEIKGFCHFEGATVADGAILGPYARLRPGADIGAGAHIGNFVEIKKAVVEEGAKVNHLSYIGDARIGARANIGAGTITCNYDGFDKYITDIGAGAFVGSNTCLVAPVKLADGAYIGSGSVITEDVGRDALALTRAPQTQKPGWAAKFRARKASEKSRKPQE